MFELLKYLFGILLKQNVINQLINKVLFSAL